MNKAKKIAGAIMSGILACTMALSLAACAGDSTAGVAGPQGPQGPQGEQGPAGPAGETPYIGDNGNWWIGDYDTGIFAGSPNVPAEVETLQEILVGTQDEVTGFLEANGMFYSDYADLATARQKTRELNIQAALEGSVLLKNEDSALPLKSTEKRVTMFGICSAYPLYGGGGAGSGIPDSYGVASTSIKDSLESVGMAVNPATYSYYRNNYTQGNSDNASFGDTVEDTRGAFAECSGSFYNYDDAAIVVIGRTGSEGRDLSMTNAAGRSSADETKHNLELTDGEKELIRQAKAHFDKVIVLLNSANVLEMAELNAPKTSDNLGVDAILWIGHTGNDQAAAVGPILTGLTNPSGHTSDTWNTDLLTIPSSYNVGSMAHVTEDDGTPYDNYIYGPDGRTDFHSVEYREGIYMGYKYYETKYADMEAAEEGSGEEWYDSQVIYPFGYGLSYTSFEWELVGAGEGAITAANETITMQVKVTNTGTVAGKDVVQMYVNPPYTLGEIEKSSANLMDFAKTDVLQPGESQVVTLQCVAQDFASFDWNDANFNDFYGYELEAGDYIISAKRNSHDSVIDITRTVEQDITCPTDYTTGNEIVPVFSQTSGDWAEFYSVNDTLLANSMTRMDGFAMVESEGFASNREQRTVAQSVLDKFEERAATWAADDGPEDYWYVADDGIPEGWSQSSSESVYTFDEGEVRDNEDGTPGTRHRNDIYEATRVNGEKTGIQLFDMAGVPFTDYTIDENNRIVVGTDAGSQKWEQFLNQLTWEEMLQIANNGSYTRYKVDSIGMTTQADMDGSTQLGWSITTASWADWICNAISTTSCFVPAITVACTWNKDLAYDLGNAMGNEALLVNYDGLYGYSMNLHRSPFSGRNYEYYSEDGVLSGKIAAQQTLGVTEKGVVTYIKHLVLNDTETNRGGIATYATEQVIRELYFKPFEMCIKEGRSMGIMNSMNRIGSVRVYANGAVHDGILRNEWNFKGITLTDAYSSGYSPVNACLRNGVDLPLGTTTMSSGGIEICKYDPETNMVYVTPEGRYQSIEDYEIVGGPTGENGTPVTGTQYKMTEEADAELTEASPTQWYVIRRAVAHILYTTANSAGMRNGAYENYSQANVEASGNFVYFWNAPQYWSVYQSIIPEIELTNCKLVEGQDIPEWLQVTEEGRVLINIDSTDLDEVRAALGCGEDGSVTIEFQMEAVLFNRVGVTGHYTYTPEGQVDPTWDSDMGHPFVITVTLTITP